MRIVISEFMDEAAVDTLRQRFGPDAIHYDANLVDNPAALAAAVARDWRVRAPVSATLVDAMVASVDDPVFDGPHIN